MPHLLVVDDEPSICWGLMKLAIGMGLSAESAASAEKGLELAPESTSPTSCFSMCVCPAWDGLTAMKRFRERMVGGVDSPRADRRDDGLR